MKSRTRDERGRFVDKNRLSDALDRYISEPNSGCWIWEGAPNGCGYGQFRCEKKYHMADKIFYQLLKGPIPTGMTIDHLCRNRLCVNPNHLEVVTNKENILRGFNMAAHHAKQTQCIHGHPFDESNTYIRPNGGRACKKCMLESSRRYKEKIRRKFHETIFTFDDIAS